MKLRFSIFLAVSLLLIFSCAGTPKTDEQIEESVEGPIEDVSADTPINDEVASIEETEEQLAEVLPSDFQDEITKSGLNELPFEITELPVEEPPAPAPTQDLPSEPPVQVQALPEEPPAPELAQEQRPRLPPPSLPRQTPSVSPPATLGPAEEITKEREPFIPPRAEPEREPPVRIADIPPSAAVVPQDRETVFSRTVRATVGQLIEIPFRGTGWVYLGELASRRGIAYDSRRLDPEGQSFIFRAEEAGTYALKFFRQDFIRDYILNDHVQVIVGETPTVGTGWFNPPRDLGRVVAEPRWPSALDEAQIQRGALVTPGSNPSVNIPPAVSSVTVPDSRETVPAQTPSEQTSASVSVPTQPPVSGQGTAPTQAVVPTQPSRPQPSSSQNSEGSLPISPPSQAASVPNTEQMLGETSAQETGAPIEKQESLPPEIILQRAKETFDGGNAQAAIALLDQYAQIFPGGTDELYWYYGQFYEANTPSRNILLSLDYYRRLVNEFPQSSRLNDARRRISYLERFYINIQ